MARFAQMLRVPIDPFLLNRDRSIPFGALKIANRRFDAIRASHIAVDRIAEVLFSTYPAKIAPISLRIHRYDVNLPRGPKEFKKLRDCERKIENLQVLNEIFSRTTHHRPYFEWLKNRCLRLPNFRTRLEISEIEHFERDCFIDRCP